MLEEVKKAPKRPRKQNILLRIVIFLLTIALMLGALALIFARDKINLDSIRRYLSYRDMLSQGEAGVGEPFPCEGALAAAAGVGQDLLCVSAGGVRLYDLAGQAFVDETALLKNPVCAVSDFGAVVYDAGGSFLAVYRDRVEVFTLPEGGDAVLSARLNDSGWLAVVTRSSGYKAVVTVYNQTFRPVNAFRLSSSFAMDAVVSPDNKTVAVVIAGQSGHTFESKLITYPIRTDPSAAAEAELKPAAELSLGNGVILDLCWSGAGIRALTEQGIVTANAKLEKTGGISWAGEHLKEFSQKGADFSVVLVARHRAGNAARLITVDGGGEVLASLDLNEQILSISAAGRYVAVLTAGRLEVFTRDLTSYAVNTEVQTARRALVRTDGSLIMATGESAWLYVPE